MFAAILEISIFGSTAYNQVFDFFIVFHEPMCLKTI